MSNSSIANQIHIAVFAGFKGVLLCSFTKSWFCFGGVLEHALMLGGLHYYNTFLPSLTQTARLVPGLMKARLPKNEMCCDWLAVPVRCDWRTVRRCFRRQINSLPEGGAVRAGELEVSPVMLYTKQSSCHKRCFIRHYMQDEMKITSKIFWKQLVSIRNTVI